MKHNTHHHIIAAVLLSMAILPAVQGADYFLRAEEYVRVMPDGAAVTMWGYALDSSFSAGDGVPTSPGPVLTVPPGDSSLTLFLDNNLAVATSLMVMGQTTPHPRRLDDGRARAFTAEIPAGNVTPAKYRWTGLRPGTYLYQSGSHPAVQVQMGLYGAAVVDYLPGQAYDHPEGAYDNEVVLLLSEIDPRLHAAVAGGEYGPGRAVTSTIDYTPRYFLFNGQTFADASSIQAGVPGQRTLVRFLNAGLETHTPMLLGAAMTLIAEDGYPRSHWTESYSLLLPAGGTMDAVMQVDTAGYYTLIDRSLNVRDDKRPGGMMVYLAFAGDGYRRLQIVRSGRGLGSIEVVGLPGGISCGDDCEEEYIAGTEVLLRALAEPGHRFAGWSGGGCTGTGDCLIRLDDDVRIKAGFFPDKKQKPAFRSLGAVTGGFTSWGG
ncbi:multicopper oxidase domain-containing protein [bacterium]|nr:multicopper oxidase domain-containing protein [candidate division CSSED10-310 bacterium]